MNDSTPEKIFEVNLVHRMIGGDPTAEGELVQTFGRGLAFFLQKEVRDPHVAEDFFQDTFRIAIEKIRAGKLEHPERLRAFLIGIARFVVRDHFRRERKRERSLEPETIDTIELPGENPLSELLRKDCSHEIREGIRSLKSDRDRQVIFRFFIAQDDKSEICRDLNLTPIHFNRVLHRAKQRFKLLLFKRGKKFGPGQSFEQRAKTPNPSDEKERD